MKVGEAYEDGSRSDALTFGKGTDGGYVLKNSQVIFKLFLLIEFFLSFITPNKTLLIKKLKNFRITGLLRWQQFYQR